MAFLICFKGVGWPQNAHTVLCCGEKKKKSYLASQ